MSEGLEYLVGAGYGSRSTVKINPSCGVTSTTATSDLSVAVQDLKLAARAFLQTHSAAQTKAEIIMTVRRRLQEMG